MGGVEVAGVKVRGIGERRELGVTDWDVVGVCVYV